MILSAPVIKADDSPFIDKHFAQDSALVLLNGAVISAALEAICRAGVTLPGNQGSAFCQHFAPEAAVFLHLASSQWPTDVMEAWSYLNMALFAWTMVYIDYSPNPLESHVRWAVTYMIYQQVVRTVANTAAYYLTGSNNTYVPSYVMFNGISTGLIMGGLSLWFMYKQTLQYKPSVLVIASAGVALLSTFFYFFLEGSDKISFSEKGGVVAEAVAEAVAGAVAVAVAGAVAGAEAGAVAGAGARVVAVAGAITGAITGAETVAVAGAVAGAGAFIIVITGTMTFTLSQCSVTLPIIRFPIISSLTMTTAAGLPLMLSSWLVSWNRFVEANTTAHETMQNEFIFSLNKLRVFYPESWINLPHVWEWFTD